ncbi:MAG: helix-turn-helix domain-containing protein [Caulobacterales bacterium]
MPLDTGAFADVSQPAGEEPPAAARRARLTLDPSLDVGAGLKQARESLGLSLDEIAEATRVRAAHLEAIESLALDKLPSRPFTIGYVRAYAKALGMDADSVAGRFRAENPSPDDELRSPVGVRHNHVKRNRSLVLLGALMAVAVVGWNVARHAMADAPRKAAGGHLAVTAPHPANAVSSGPFEAGAPLPAPPEATAPAPYTTPGLPAANAAGGTTQAVIAPTNAVAAKASAAQSDAPPTPFVAQGTIYGPTTGASNLVIQARKSISLEVTGPGGVVYFARQLAAGEAYRVPALPGLTAEVSNPDSAEIFKSGVSHGVFTQPQMPLNIAG